MEPFNRVRWVIAASAVWSAACGRGTVHLTDTTTDTDGQISVAHDDSRDTDHDNTDRTDTDRSTDTDRDTDRSTDTVDTDRPVDTDGDTGTSTDTDHLDTDRTDTDHAVGDTDLPDTDRPDTGTPLPNAPSLSRTWATPVPIDELNTAWNEIDGTMTRDRLRICFASDRSGGGGGGYDLWCADRLHTTNAFDPPFPLTAIASASDDTHPSLSADGLELYFTSSRDGNQHLYRAGLTAAGTYDNAAPVGSINSGSADFEGSLSSIGRAMVFGSDRSGDDLVYLATRPNLLPTFTSVSTIPGVTTGGDARDPALAQDGSTIVFSSDRPWPGFSTSFSPQLWGADGGGGVFTNPYMLVFENFEEPQVTGPCPLSDGTLLLSAHVGSGSLASEQDLMIAAPKAGVVDLRGVLPRVFGALDIRAAHSVGHASADGWTADPALDVPGHMVFGPYTREIPAGHHTATFTMHVDATSAATNAIVTIEVETNTGATSLAKRDVQWNEFTSTSYQSFDLSFTNQEGDELEFRTYFDDVATVTAGSVTIH